MESVCYVLTRTVMPEGLCCGQMLPALFQNAPLSPHLTPYPFLLCLPKPIFSYHSSVPGSESIS